MNLRSVRAEIKAPTLSNSAKLLAGYMKATGISDAKALAEALDVSLRTIQRLKLDIATCATDGVSSDANDAKCATGGGANNANDATDGVSDAPSAPPVASRVRVEDNNLTTNLEITVEDNTPPTPLKRVKSDRPTPRDALLAFEAYNATALACGLQQATKLTPDRQRKIIARLADYGLEGWHRALANIERSSFLTGTNDRGWRANLEFLMQAASFAKVHDGTYGNGRHARTKSAPRAAIAWIAPTPEELRAINA